MITRNNILTIAVIAAVLPFTAMAAIDWVVDIMPGTVLASIAADDFSVTGGNGKETLSLITTVPSVTVGGSLENRWGFIDAKLGAGMLLNGKIGSPMVVGVATLHKEVKPSIMAGAHAGIVYYMDPEWWGDTDIDFKSTTGFLIGLNVSAGDRISYLLQIDYMSVAFDVDRAGAGVAVSHPELDMSGMAIQFGVRAQF